MLPALSISVSSFTTENDECPIEVWLDGLDRPSRARLLARIAKIRAGNLGDWSSLQNGNGVCEFREHFGPGYRIYFARETQRIILLLCGSNKSDQKKTIKLAKSFWAEYQKQNATGIS